ncbi:MAG: hypothetical protein EPN47_11820 [Acidobacteria bacterium]|nr:MAG: hypothetical protein EPN47_11820 [Acidobacteriota bacterium]
MASESVALGTRWIARAWSILSIIYVLILAAGEILRNQGPASAAQEWFGVALFPIGVCAGLALAWFHERLGGFLALGCFVAFYAWNLLWSGSIPHSPFYLWIAAPSILFIAAGIQTHRIAHGGIRR